MKIAWLCVQFYTPVSNRCVWNSQIHSFEGVSTYLCVYIVFFRFDPIVQQVLLFGILYHTASCIALGTNPFNVLVTGKTEATDCNGQLPTVYTPLLTPLCLLTAPQVPMTWSQATPPLIQRGGLMLRTYFSWMHSVVQLAIHFPFPSCPAEMLISHTSQWLHSSLDKYRLVV